MQNRQTVNLFFIFLTLTSLFFLIIQMPTSHLLLAGILIYWLANGLTEGFQYASPEQKKENRLIGKNNLFDYHTWRLIENAGVLLAIWGTIIEYLEIKMLAGSWLVGWFVYDVAFAYILNRRFGERSDYKIGFIIIPLSALPIGLMAIWQLAKLFLGLWLIYKF